MTEIPSGELILPLFPLPNVVFFPGTRLPLHVFEPRYRRMVTDALAGQERLGVILLKPGWEADYYGTPAIHDYGTLGTIEQAVSLDDGRYNVLLRGDVRFRIVEPLEEAPYRVARVLAVPELNGDPMANLGQREWLVELSRRYLDLVQADDKEVPELETATLDSLTNALIMSLNLHVEEKQQLLEIDELIERADRIADELHKRIENLSFLAPFRRTGNDPSRN
ncbi:MAG TPA: LON peptidase substrate-binding domain-containing protein [Thermoanaerobaculia bacterium]|nr:LON peptidase substrate-binding domain-containing protein [Thermoanaerobaculia bacterium]